MSPKLQQEPVRSNEAVSGLDTEGARVNRSESLDALNQRNEDIENSVIFDPSMRGNSVSISTAAATTNQREIDLEQQRANLGPSGEKKKSRRGRKAWLDQVLKDQPAELVDALEDALDALEGSRGGGLEVSAAELINNLKKAVQALEGAGLPLELQNGRLAERESLKEMVNQLTSGEFAPEVIDQLLDATTGQLLTQESHAEAATVAAVEIAPPQSLEEILERADSLRALQRFIDVVEPEVLAEQVASFQSEQGQSFHAVILQKLSPIDHPLVEHLLNSGELSVDLLQERLGRHAEIYGQRRAILERLGDTAGIAALDSQFSKTIDANRDLLDGNLELATNLDQTVLAQQHFIASVYERIDRAPETGEDVSEFIDFRDRLEIQAFNERIQRSVAAGELDQAIELAKRFVARDHGALGEEVSALTLGGLAHERLRGLPEEDRRREELLQLAISNYQAVQSSYRYGTEASFALAQLHRENGQSAQAEAIYSQVIEEEWRHRREDVRQAHLGLGTCLFEQGRYQEAIQHLEEVTFNDRDREQMPEHVAETEQLVKQMSDQAWLRLASEAVANQNGEAALASLNDAALADPNSPMAAHLRHRAAFMRSAHQVREAQDVFYEKRCREQWELTSGSWKQVEAHWKAHAEAKRGLVGAWTWTTGTLKEIRNMAEAETKHAEELARHARHLDRVLEQSRESSQSALKLEAEAAGLFEEGDIDEANELYQEAVRRLTAANSQIEGGELLITSPEYQAEMARITEALRGKDELMGGIEWGMRTTRTVCVATTATIATGGLAAAGAGTGLAVLGGIGAGSTLGLIGNTVEGGGHVYYGNKSLGQAASDAFNATIEDMKTSAIGAASAGVGAYVAGGLKAGQAGVSVVRQVGVGSLAGGSSAGVSTVAYTMDGYVAAWSEFNDVCRGQNYTAEQKGQVWAQILQQRNLEWDDVAKTAALNLGIGFFGGGVGGAGNAARGVNTSVRREVGVALAETGVMGGAEAASMAIEGDFSAQRLTQGISSVAIGDFGAGMASGATRAKVDVDTATPRPSVEVAEARPAKDVDGPRPRPEVDGAETDVAAVGSPETTAVDTDVETAPAGDVAAAETTTVPDSNTAVEVDAGTEQIAQLEAWQKYNQEILDQGGALVDGTQVDPVQVQQEIAATEAKIDSEVQKQEFAAQRRRQDEIAEQNRAAAAARNAETQRQQSQRDQQPTETLTQQEKRLQDWREHQLELRNNPVLSDGTKVDVKAVDAEIRATDARLAEIAEQRAQTDKVLDDILKQGEQARAQEEARQRQAEIERRQAELDAQPAAEKIEQLERWVDYNKNQLQTGRLADGTAVDPKAVETEIVRATAEIEGLRTAEQARLEAEQATPVETEAPKQVATETKVEVTPQAEIQNLRKWAAHNRELLETGQLPDGTPVDPVVARQTINDAEARIEALESSLRVEPQVEPQPETPQAKPQSEPEPQSVGERVEQLDSWRRYNEEILERGGLVDGTPVDPEGVRAEIAKAEEELARLRDQQALVDGLLSGNVRVAETEVKHDPKASRDSGLGDFLNQIDLGGGPTPHVDTVAPVRASEGPGSATSGDTGGFSGGGGSSSGSSPSPSGGGGGAEVVLERRVVDAVEKQRAVDPRTGETVEVEVPVRKVEFVETTRAPEAQTRNAQVEEILEGLDLQATERAVAEAKAAEVDQLLGQLDLSQSADPARELVARLPQELDSKACRELWNSEALSDDVKAKLWDQFDDQGYLTREQVETALKPDPAVAPSAPEPVVDPEPAVAANTVEQVYDDMMAWKDQFDRGEYDFLRNDSAQEPDLGPMLDPGPSHQPMAGDYGPAAPQREPSVGVAVMEPPTLPKVDILNQVEVGPEARLADPIALVEVRPEVDVRPEVEVLPEVEVRPGIEEVTRPTEAEPEVKPQVEPETVTRPEAKVEPRAEEAVETNLRPEELTRVLTKPRPDVAPQPFARGISEDLMTATRERNRIPRDRDFGSGENEDKKRPNDEGEEDRRIRYGEPTFETRKSDPSIPRRVRREFIAKKNAFGDDVTVWEDEDA